MPKLPKNLPHILRKYGLKVVEVAGWEDRGRPAYTGTFDPVGVLCHHTATSRHEPVQQTLDLLVKGRSDLPGPLCQLSLGRDGTVYIVAAGRANHAGVAKASGSVAAGDGNTLYIGIEAMNDGVSERYPDVQYAAYVLLAAVLCKEITHNSVKTVRGHKETSVEGKVDPRFSMLKFRNLVELKLKDINGPGPAPIEYTRGGRIDRFIKGLRIAQKANKGDRRRHIHAALKELLAVKRFPKKS